ncbi:glycoside hydrolase family 16 protein [Nitrobacter sp. NHB1]|uniref:glycoside hydrolase family 16 protein n=1 Tax=Nitrobacter sp. NHB1 TaxID=3119830 RepID=UPI002FFD99ED
MALSTPAGYSSGDLVFQEDFNGTTLGSTWHNYITSNAAKGAPWNDNGSGGSGPGGQYDADYHMPSQVAVSNGTLNLTATKASITGNNQGKTQTFPITSGAASSYGNFEFTGGYLQISMKAPSGDGAWPGLWLLPGKGAGNSGDNFEIDMQEGGYTGSGPANQAFSAGLHTPNGTFQKVVDSGVDLTAGFHTYGIDWVPGKSITWYLDGKQMAQVTSAEKPIPSQPMQLIMDNQVANSNTAGWHTVLNNSTPSSMLMQVDAIQLYQTPGSGNTVTGANVSASNPPPVTTPPVTDPPVITPPTTTPPEVRPTVTQATASPGKGVEHVGDKVTLTLGFNEAVTVTGKPTLTLNDGGTATYVGGSGTNALTFQTTVAATNTSTSALAITKVNLPGGASVKDASGLSANLSGAVKTFAGLQIDPSPVSSSGDGTETGTTTPPVITPPATSTATKPVLSVADHSLSVDAHGSIDLGLSVKSSDPNDSVSVNIKGLPRYETITSNSDGKTFRGNNITLTAAQVDGGLTLHSNYRGSGHPVATLTATATGKDPVTGAVATSAAQTITVTDPPAASAGTSPPAASAGTSHCHANHSFALLNQYLAGGGFSGRMDHGQIATAASKASTWLNESFLTRPRH